MKVRKKKTGGPEGASSGPVQYHQINCPGCGKLIKKMKKQKETIKESFECSRCETRFSLTFPGLDESKENWLAGHGDEFTSFKLR